MNEKLNNVVVFSYKHPLTEKIHYKGIFVYLNGYLFVRIIERDGKIITNTLTKKDTPAVARFLLKNIEFENFLNGPNEIGLKIAQAIHDSKKETPESSPTNISTGEEVVLFN